MTVDIGALAPDFTLKNQNGEDIILSSFRDHKNVLVVFYPFAFSGICTSELCEIGDDLADFVSHDVEVLAISCDPMFTLRAFADQEGYDFSLLSDFWPHGQVGSAYGVFNEQVGASARGTYLIDTTGTTRWKVESGLGDKRDIGAYKKALQLL